MKLNITNVLKGKHLLLQFSCKRKLFKLSLLLFIIAGINMAASAQSFRTPTFSGATSDFTAAELYNSVNNVDYYVTYDATYIYFGAFRNSGNTWGAFDHFNIYIDSDPTSTVTTGGTGTTTGVTWDGNTPTQPFTANYRICIRPGSAGTGESFKSTWGGGPWTTTAANAPGWTQYTSTAANGAMEVRVPWADIGSPDGIYFNMYCSYTTGYFGAAPSGTASAAPNGNYFGGIGTSSANCIPKNITNLPIIANSLNTANPSTTVPYGKMVINANTTLANNYSIAPGGSIQVTAGTYTISGRTITFGGSTIGDGRGTTINTSGTGSVVSTSATTLTFNGEGNIVGNALSTPAIININRQFTPLAAGAFTLASGGILQVLPNGYVATNSINYATGSTLSFQTATTYNVGAGDKTWAVGTSGAGVPDKVLLNASGTIVNIAENRTATSTLTINSANTLNNNTNTLTIAPAITTAASAITMAGGIFNNNGGTVNVGPSGGGNQAFNMSGVSATLNINSGTININGNFTDAGVLNQSGGLISIDGNSGTAATSVVSGTHLFSFASTTTAACSAGTIRIVDPPHSSYATSTTRALSLQGVVGTYMFTGTHTFEFGDGVSTTPGNADGFVIESFTGVNRVAINNVIVNAGNASGRWVSSSYGTSSYGTFIQGNLTINANSEFRVGTSGAIFSIAGNVINNGTLTSTATAAQFQLASLPSGGGSAPAANPNLQSFSGSGTFRNATASPTASFIGMTINNSNATIPAVTFNIGNTTFSGGLVLTAGVLDVGATNDIGFTSAATLTRTNGWVIRSGTGQMKKDFLTGSSNFSFFIGDNTGTPEYSPFVLSFSANNTNRTIGVNVTDAKHPSMDIGGTQTDYISRYWTLTNSAAGTYTYNTSLGTATYLAADINGTEANMKLNRWNGTAWSELPSSTAGSNTLTIGASGGTETIFPLTGDYSGRVTPTTIFTWVGGTSNDFNTPANWDLGAVPTSTDDIIISVASPNPCSINSGSFTVNNITVSGTGNFQMAASTSLTVTNNVTYSSSVAPSLDCSSTIIFNKLAALTIPAWNYGNLTCANSALRSWTGSATTGICGVFTPGTSTTYTATSGSTVDYIGTGSQIIRSVNYYNLSNSGNGPRSYDAVTGTIDVANVFSPTTNTVTTGTANTFNFSNAGAQTIPTTVYYNVTNTGNGARTLAPTGANANKVSIGNFFSLGSGAYTVLNSTVEYLGNGAYTMVAFTFHHLIFNSNGTGVYNFPTTGNLSVNGDLTITASGTSSTLNVGSVASTPKILTVSGNVNIQNSGVLQMVTNSTGTGTANITGSLNISGTGKINLEQTSSSGTGIINITTDFNSTGTSVATGGANGIVDFGTGTITGNGIFIKGNFSHTTAGTFGTSSATAASGFVFNNSSVLQTLTYTGATSSYTNFQVSAGAIVRLSNSFTMGSFTGPVSTFTVAGTLDCVDKVITAGDANSNVVLSTNGVLKTANANGVTGSLAGFTVGKITGTSAIFQFNGTTQNTGFPSNITTANGIDMIGGTAVSLNQAFSLNTSGIFNFTNNGLFILGANNFTFPATSTLNGGPFSASKMFVTNSTGYLQKAFTASGTFTWPIGDNTGTTEYSPATLTFNPGAGGTLGIRVIDAVHPNNAPASDYIARYWNTTTTSSSYSWTGTLTYPSADIVGTESNMKLNIWDPNAPSSGWTQYSSSTVGSNTITVSGGPGTGSFNNTDITARADIPYYYRTITSGAWATPGIWERSTDPLFISPAPIAATVAPNNANSYGIQIRNTHTVTVGSTIYADDIDVQIGGVLTIGASGNMTLPNGAAATDLTVNGTLNINNTTTFASGTGTIINGLVKSTVSPSSFGTITVSSTGIYEHAIDGGTVPVCTWQPPTPGIGATLKITGMNVSSSLGGLNQTFQNIEFANVSQSTATLQILGDIVGINGNLTMSASGTRQVRLFGNSTSNTLYSLTVGGNLIVSGGSLGLMNSGTSGSANCTIRVKGDVTISGGTFDMTGSSANTGGSSNLEIEGNLTVSGTGTLVKTQATPSNITFLKATATPVQQFTSYSTGVSANVINWFVGTGTTPNTVQLNSNIALNASSTITTRNAATLDILAENILTGGTSVISSGGTLKIGSINGITTTTGATSGNVQTTNRTYTAGCNFTYASLIANQVTGNGLPTTITGFLAIANAGTAPTNIVTMTNLATTATTLNLISGRFYAGTLGTLSIASGGTINGTGGNQQLAGTAADNIIQIAGANGATINGTPELWNVTIGGNTTSGANFVNNARINNILLINNQGAVTSNSPKYAVGSTLIYNPGGSYNRNLEWGSNTPLAPSYPHHVIIKNNTTVNFTGSTTFDVGCGGDLTIGEAAATGTGALSLAGMGTYDLYVGGNLTIGGNIATSSLSMSNTVGGDVYLTGNWTRNANGTVNFGSGDGRAVFFTGSTNATITANGGQLFPFAYVNKATKATKLTLADHVSISDEIGFTQGTVDLGTNNKFLTILSTATKTGRVGQSSAANTAFVYGSSDLQGQFIVQRYMPARRAWRLMAAPFNPAITTHTISEAWQERGTSVSGMDYTSANWAASVAADSITTGFGTHITGGTAANGFDLSPTNNSGIKYYSSGSWVTPANTNTTSVKSREGWMLFVRGDRKSFGEITTQYKTPTITTLRPRGQIFIGSKAITATGLTVVGNPYASALDYHTATKTGGSIAGTDTYYMWDPYLGGTFGVGAFVTLTWNGSNYTRSAPLTGTGTSTVDQRYIPSGAAILVDFGASSGTLTFNESDKNANNTTTAFRMAGQVQTGLYFTNTDGTLAVVDGALSIFGHTFNNAVDRQDAIKLGNFSENFSIKRDSQLLSVEKRKNIQEADTIFYNLANMKQKKYKFAVISSSPGAAPGLAAFMEDTYLKQKTAVRLQDTTWIDFDITADMASANADRFRLVFKKASKYLAVEAAVVNKDISVNWKVAEDLNIDRYEIEKSINGISFETIGRKGNIDNNANSVAYNWLDVSPAPGLYYYRIKCTSNFGVITYSDIVKVRIAKSSPEMYVFPNPVTNGIIQLQMNGLPAGVYTARLLGNNGQLISTQKINHAGGTATQSIVPESILVNGAYQLEVTKPDKHQEIIKVIVQ